MRRATERPLFFCGGNMQIEEINVKELVPYERNPRKNDKSVDKVAESIKTFGFKVPIVIDKDNVVVCGHTRLKAAKKLGLEKAPCIRADDLNEEQIRAFRLADNKVGEESEWDFNELGDYEAMLQRKLVRLNRRRMLAQIRINALNDSRQRQILDLYFLSGRRYTMTDVAALVGYSREQTYRLYCQALRNMTMNDI